MSDIEFIVESVAKRAAISYKIISQELILESIKTIEKSISESELEFFDNIYFPDKKENNRRIW